MQTLKDQPEDGQARIAALPSVKFLWGRDWAYGPWCYAFGVMWDKDHAPNEGASVYRRRFVLHLTLHLWLEQ